MFEAAFPERFFNVGIAEPALVDVAVGLANSGFVPIANTFAFLFATRAVEMVRTHLCFGGANVKLAGAYAGLSDSFDGPTHHSVTDLAILRSLPGMTVVVPADPLAIRLLLPQVAAFPGPVFFRLSRNEAPQIFTEQYAPEIGKGIVLSEGRGRHRHCVRRAGGPHFTGRTGASGAGRRGAGGGDAYHQAAGCGPGGEVRERDGSGGHGRGALGDRGVGERGGGVSGRRLSHSARARGRQRHLRRKRGLIRNCWISTV